MSCDDGAVKSSIAETIGLWMKRQNLTENKSGGRRVTVSPRKRKKTRGGVFVVIFEYL